MHVTAALRPPVISSAGRRALVLVGLGVGLWVAGSATSSAAADDSPVAPLTTAVQDVADQAGGLPAPVTSAVEPVVAPVAEATVAPVVQAVAPVVESVAPVVDAVSPVLDPVVATSMPVLEPVGAAVSPALEPVNREVVEPTRAAVGAPIAAEVPAGSPVVAAPAASSPSGESAAPNSSDPAVAAHAAAARVGGVVEHLIGDATAVPAPVPGGNHVSVRGPALPAGAPAPAAASGPSSPDQPAADLPPAGRLVDPAALYAAADDARDAAADRALDPSFAPD